MIQCLLDANPEVTIENFDTIFSTKETSTVRDFADELAEEFAQSLRIEFIRAVISALRHLPCSGAIVLSIKGSALVTQGRLTFYTPRSLLIGKRHVNKLITYCERFAKQYPGTELLMETSYTCEHKARHH